MEREKAFKSLLIHTKKYKFYELKKTDRYLNNCLEKWINWLLTSVDSTSNLLSTKNIF